MPTLTIKNIPQELYEALRQSAAETRRSLSNEILFRPEASMGKRGVDPQEVLERIRALRAKTSPTTAEEINRAKATRRP